MSNGNLNNDDEKKKFRYLHIFKTASVNSSYELSAEFKSNIHISRWKKKKNKIEFDIFRKHNQYPQNQFRFMLMKYKWI